MKPRLQGKASVIINVPRDQVWSIVDDVSLIPQYHPEVSKVELLSGEHRRRVGLKYRCVISEGPRKGSCVEEVTACVPGERMTTAFPEDTWGISKMLAGFVVEAVLVTKSEHETEIVLKAYYEPIGWTIRLMNLVFLRWIMAHRAQRTIKGIKRLAEERVRAVSFSI